jgi:hypothetical protein
MTIESKKELSLTLEETPTVLVTGGAQLIPQEAAGDVIVQLAGLLQQATQQRIPEAQTQSFNLDRAKFSYKTKDYDTAYLAARDALDKLIVAARPYIWLEGEDALVHTFSETAPNGEASSGAYLRLSTPTPPGRAGYGARYLFNVPTDGRYNIWLAGSIPGPEVSPIQWRINSDPTQSPASATAQGLYLDGQFGWTLLGTAELKQGENQSLTVYVTDRAPATGNYSFAIDSLLLIRQKFTPNGTLRPLPFDPATLPPLDKEKPRSKGGQSH